MHSQILSSRIVGSGFVRLLIASLAIPALVACGDPDAQDSNSETSQPGSDAGSGSNNTTANTFADGGSSQSNTSTNGDDKAADAGASASGENSDAGQSGNEAPGTDASASWWKPAPFTTTWQWQLDGTLDTSLNVGMYDIDMEDNDAATIAAFQKRGIKVVCYVDVGTYEPGRSDSASFPAAVLGAGVDGWPGEKWLDITSPTVKTIMMARFVRAQAKGCDGIEPDNVDGYENKPGFSFTGADQETYNKWVATSVRSLGMAVALKNDTDQIPDLVSYFDFELDEQCFQYSECDTLTPFITAGKAVFEVEYGTASLQTKDCTQANSMKLDTLIKDLDLDAFRISCQ